MLSVTNVAGNIYSDRRLANKWLRANATGSAERLLVARNDMDKVRMRRMTDQGTDIGLVLERGQRLHHGDVLTVEGGLILVEQLPEKVISIAIGKGSQSKLVEAATLIGHAIGNRHRSIAIEGGKILFPIQDESEVQSFAKLLPRSAKLKVETQVFIPSSEVGHQHG